MTLGYSTGGFSISVTDYWFNTQVPTNKYFKYGAHSTAHVFEAQVGYDFGPLASTGTRTLQVPTELKKTGKGLILPTSHLVHRSALEDLTGQ